MAPSELEQSTLRRKRSSLLVSTALLILSFTWIDFVGPHEGAWTVLVRLLWAGSFLLAARGARLGTRGAIRATAYLLAVSAPLAFYALSMLTGGLASANFPWLVVVPLAAALLAPEDVGAIVTAGVLSMIAGLSIVYASASSGELAAWIGSFCAATAMGAVLGNRIHAQQQAAFAAIDERQRALADLEVSERRRMHAERLATVGTLAAGVAHEINNPLSFVRSNLACLDRAAAGQDPLPPEEQREVLAESLVGVERIQQIVADLRTFARADEGTGAPIEVRAAVEEAVRIASLRLRGVAKVETRVAAELPPVPGPHARLVQALTNLLVNAGDALAESGGEPLVIVEAQRLGGRVRLAVEDHGPGLPERVREHLFEPFVTTKPPGRGTGLGLPLTREYVLQLGGDIHLVDRPGGGTRFEIDLPAASAA